jgi:hypothetical protein
MKYIVILIVGIIGSLIIRKLVARIDREPMRAQPEDGSPKQIDTPTEAEILHVWGRLAETQEVSITGPIHTTVVEYLRRYDSIGPDKYLRVLETQLASKPFDENNTFTQIGVWGDGAAVVVRRSLSDAKIYLADFEDSTPDHPKVFAISFEEYLRKAWQYNQDSLRYKFTKRRS